MPRIAHNPTTHRAGYPHASVRDFMSGDPACVRHSTTVRKAAAFLKVRRIGAVLVVDDSGGAVGVLSRWDILRAVLAGGDEALVRDVMSPAMIAVLPDVDVRQAAELMVRHKVQRIFVVDVDGVPIGVLTMTDVFRALRYLRGEHAAETASF